LRIHSGRQPEGWVGNVEPTAHFSFVADGHRHAVFGELIKHSKKLVLVSFAFGMSLIAVLSLAVRLL
jgi:hypothetical protein